MTWPFLERASWLLSQLRDSACTYTNYAGARPRASWLYVGKPWCSKEARFASSAERPYEIGSMVEPAYRWEEKAKSSPTRLHLSQKFRPTSMAYSEVHGFHDSQSHQYPRRRTPFLPSPHTAGCVKDLLACSAGRGEKRFSQICGGRKKRKRKDRRHTQATEHAFRNATHLRKAGSANMSRVQYLVLLSRSPSTMGSSRCCKQGVHHPIASVCSVQASRQPVKDEGGAADMVSLVVVLQLRDTHGARLDHAREEGRAFIVDLMNGPMADRVSNGNLLRNDASGIDKFQALLACHFAPGPP